MPRIGAQYHALLSEIAECKKCSLAEALELALEIAIDAMEGRPARAEHLRYKPGFLPFARDQLRYRKKYPE